MVAVSKENKGEKGMELNGKLMARIRECGNEDVAGALEILKELKGIAGDKESQVNSAQVTESKSVSEYLKADPKDVLRFLHIVRQLKSNKRTGWLLRGIPTERAESISDHMYRMSIICQVIQDDRIDRDKCMKMALVHDLAEAIVGDITPDCGIPREEKIRREAEAMNLMKDLLADNPYGTEFLQLWQEYDSDGTPEANFVKDIDKFELILQSVEYEQTELRSFDLFVRNSREKIRHPALRELTRLVEEERPKDLTE